ncbi:MAG: hypothetical protein M5R42_15800 [Rhodocyclaceae bacterium]|nr:hypothetical protein [Rhodocyclaceae bacterium]
MAEPYRLETWQSGVDAAIHAERVRLLYDLARIAIAAMLAVALLVAPSSCGRSWRVARSCSGCP